MTAQAVLTETVQAPCGPIRVEWDVPIAMDDGVVLRADVFRPVGDEPVPVLLSHGPYAKGLPFQEGYASAWEKLVAAHPDVAAGSSNRFQNWEVADPERWVPLGYACVRVDCRGAGRSPGVLDLWSEREVDDFAACIEWAGTQPWSTGKVGLSGISYYAMNQWQVAARRPPHLAAICPWEGSHDWYREVSYHGGILCTFVETWFGMQIVPLQHGGPREAAAPIGGLRVTGDDPVDDATRARNRVAVPEALRDNPFADADYYRDRTPDLSRIEVPVLSAGNWGGAGLHLRGNVEGYLAAGSAQKWLEVHGLEHWTEYYTAYGRDLQQQFFDHFLKGADNGWDRRPPVLLRLRHVDGTFSDRAADAWPLPGTDWAELHLDAAAGTLGRDVPAPSSATYAEQREGLTFTLPPVETTTEITGPLALTLFVESDTDDADLFAVLRVVGPDGAEVTFPGAIDPHSPPAQGWLRASHRALDPQRSTPYRPYHPHVEREPLTPGQVYEVAVEIWPTSLVLPPGYRLAVTVQGHDYEYAGAGAQRLSNIKNAMRGSGPFVHDDPTDRRTPARITLHTGGDTPSRLLVPFQPR